MIKVCVTEDDVADVVSLLVAAGHCKAARIKGHQVVDDKARQMLPAGGLF